MYLNISNEELEMLHEEIETLLGGFDIDVDVTKEELIIQLRYALSLFEKETSLWQIQNQFINAYGMPAGLVMSNQLAVINFNISRQISDWFAAMQRVGGKIPWHKDYIELEPGRQIYFLDKESSIPYASGARKIHRVMWVARPEMFNSAAYNSMPNGDDVLYSSNWNMTGSGLNYGNTRLGFLGYTFDTIMLMQAKETRNKVMFSEFFHNLSGDVLEITPMPGQAINIEPGSRVYYYYFNEKEMNVASSLINQEMNASTSESENPTALPTLNSNLIANPLDLEIQFVPWNTLSPWAQTFVKDLAFAKCKYIQGAKWRKIQKTFGTGEMSYEITFDYSSLISEALDQEKTMIENLRQDLKDLNIANLTDNQSKIVEAGIQMGKRGGRMISVG